MEIRNVPFCVISFCIIFSLPNLLSAHGVHKLPHNGESHRQADGGVYKVLANGTAKIRCDVSSNSPNDQVLLVVWYKNNLPIYSYDTRGAHAGTPSEWHDMEVLENRARLDKNTGPAVLIIDPVTEKDAGNFRCRVDFKLSPTRNSNVNLEVIVPPQAPRVYNAKREFVDGRAGPYEEGTELHLICVVTGGTPPPTITWSSNGHIMAGTSTDFSFPYSQSSKLVVHNLSRVHQHSVYTCQASNFEEKVVVTNVTIELYLRPLSVELLFGNQPLSADRRYDIQCQAVGSRPPAKITWWLNGTQVDSTNVTVSSDGNVSLSTLSFVPTRGHHNSVLACRANNELVKHGMKETFVKLNVFFVPTLTLVLGSNLNPMDIEEGDDVYFECNVEANPAAYKIVWKHNGQTVQHNHKAGVIMSSSNLALQGITRHQAGNYTCIASNVEGDGESPWYSLKVMYKPICKPEQKRIYGVGRNEAADVLCEVDAYPSPDAFKWSFNNTAETFDMPQSGYRVHSEQASTLTYTPVKEMDFGTIMCWADNVVGQQKEPCIFHLIAAGKPDQPYNCTVINQTSNSLEIDCNEGFDGGQRQWFLLELYDEEYGLLQANVSSRYPMFNVDDLEPDRAFKLLVYAANVKGRSNVVLLEGRTLKPVEKPMLKFGQQYNQFELMSMLSIAIIVGVLAVLICIGGLVYVVKLRWTKGQQQHNHHLHHGLNHHNHMQQQKGKLAIQTSNSGLLTNSSSNTPNTNSILRRMNNSSLIRPGNLPIKEKILLPANNNNTIGSNNNSIIGGGNSNSYSNHNLHNHHHIHHPGGGGGGGVGGEELYDEKNPDVVPYNKGITTATTSPSISINNFHQQQPQMILSENHNHHNHHQQNQHAAQQQSSSSCGSFATLPLATGYQIANNCNNNSNNGAATLGHSSNSGAATPVSCTNSNSNPNNNINSNGTYPAKPPFLREIVTIRTPLIFTQQESCV